MSPYGVVLMACGSFSPPTMMHLRMFEIARDHLHQIGSNHVLGGIISPVHDSYRKKGLVNARHRCAMVKLALKSSEWIRLSEWECSQEHWVSTTTSIQYHQNWINNFKNNSVNDTVDTIVPSWVPRGLDVCPGNVQVKLLCGADLLESLTHPGLWQNEDVEQILDNHGLVVVTRSGTHPERIIFDSDLLSKYKKNIIIITNWVTNEVSSSMIRRLLNREQSVKYLLDDRVIEYINANHLFKSLFTTPEHRAIQSIGVQISDEVDFSMKMDRDTTAKYYSPLPSPSKPEMILSPKIDGDSQDSEDTSKRPEKPLEEIESESFSDFLQRAIRENRLKVVRNNYCTV